ncbi:MAG: hypothetical protein PHI66_04910 [Candidatus Pacebacteria bacterium]|nr:hypothetical protein [Candidatus Paceibacterota bacterium]
MYSKKRIVKIVIFSFAIFILLLNLVDFAYSGYREVYFSEYNKEVYSDFYDYKSQNSVTEEDIKEACLSFMPRSFYKVHNTINYWNGLFIWILISMVFIMKIIDRKSEYKIFSKKNTRFLFALILASLFIYYYVGIITDSSYSYYTLRCSDFYI